MYNHTTANPHELTNKLLMELGIEEPDASLASEVEDHFAKVITEVLLRRAPEERLPEIRAKIESDGSGLEDLAADIASEIPGLSVEIEEAIIREYEVIRNMLLSRTK